jgi:hypothetical protein
MVMTKLETLAIMLCVSVLVGLAVYTLAILDVPGTHGMLQKAEALRRSTHQCTGGIIPPC